MRALLLSLCLALGSLSCAAQQASDYFNENTIRLSDVPRDAPKFIEYPAGPKYDGPVALPDLRSHPRSRLFRTRIREGAKQGPNFAGHYTIVGWGCGAGCVSYAIVDAQTGQVFHPGNFQSADDVNVDYEALEPPEGRLVKFRSDSYLLVVIGGVNENPKRRGISYFTWQNNQLQRIRFVPRPYEAKP